MGLLSEWNTQRGRQRQTEGIEIVTETEARVDEAILDVRSILGLETEDL